MRLCRALRVRGGTGPWLGRRWEPWRVLHRQSSPPRGLSQTKELLGSSPGVPCGEVWCRGVGPLQSPLQEAPEASGTQHSSPRLCLPGSSCPARASWTHTAPGDRVSPPPPHQPGAFHLMLCPPGNYLLFPSPKCF